MTEDTSWVHDLKFTHRTAVRYAFDEKALEVDEGYQRLFDELHARAMARVRAIETALLAEPERRRAFAELQLEPNVPLVVATGGGTGLVRALLHVSGAMLTGTNAVASGSLSDSSGIRPSRTCRSH